MFRRKRDEPASEDRRALYDGLRNQAPEEEFGYGRHPLSAVFHAGEAVITELRVIDETRDK
jgi:hypothetical protein